MASNKANMKVLASTHVVMATLFFIFGLVDRFEVRFPISYVVMPCWTSALIMLTGVLGLVAANKIGPLSATWTNAIWSMSIGCAILCSLIIFIYVTTLSVIIREIYLDRGVHVDSYTSLVDEEKPIGKHTDKEQKQLAITSVIITIAVVEMIVALGSAASCHGNDANYPILQENMPGPDFPHEEKMLMMMSSQPVAAVPLSD